MQLEDLFRQQRPPKDYVSYPPQEIPTLEKFFKERTPAPVEEKKIPNMFGNLMPGGDSVKSGLSSMQRDYVDPVKPEVKEAVIESEELPDERLEQIKSIFTEQPMSVEREPAQEPAVAPTVASDIANFKAIREGVAKDGYKMGMEDILPALAPLAADVLTGGTGAGIPVAADYLGKTQKGIEAKNANLESKLLELQAKRAEKKNGKGLSNEDFMLREMFKAKMKAGLKGIGLEKKDLERIQDMEVKLAKEWRQDPFTKDTRKVADSFRRIMATNPEAGDPVEDMGLIFDLMRALDPTSVVRESEQSMAIGARSYEDVVKYFSTLLSGNRKMTPTQVRNIKKFAARLYTRRLEGQREIDDQFKAMSKQYGLNQDLVVREIGQGKVPILWTNRKTGVTDVFLLPKDKAEAAIKAGAKRF